MTLTLGMKGEAVESLQLMLRFLGYYKGDINSIFEAKTTEAVEAFQKDKLASVKGTVTQLFQDQLLPFIEDIEQNPNM